MIPIMTEFLLPENFIEKSVEHLLNHVHTKKSETRWIAYSLPAAVAELLYPEARFTKDLKIIIRSSYDNDRSYDIGYFYDNLTTMLI